MKKLTIKVNDVAMSLHAEDYATLSINDYILKTDTSGKFIVVINGQVIPKSTYETTLLKDGDALDIISPITGG